MKSKTIILVIQLLFVIVVIAVIATHVRMVKNKELFADKPTVQGTVGSDQNLTVTGNIVGLSGSHQFGNSKLPDEKGDIHLTPRLGNNSVFLNGKTVLNNKLCFRQKNNNESCFDANNISKRTDNVQISDSGIQINNDKELEFGVGQRKQIDAGKIRYGGWDNSALNIIGAGADGNNRKVRVWDNLCIGDACLNSADINKVKNVVGGPDNNWTGANFLRGDKRWTHFDWADGRNYIRGDTIQDGTFTVNGKVNVSDNVCIRNECLNSADINKVKNFNAVPNNQTADFRRRDGRITHFDWADGRNYIRGDTIQDGNLTINDGKLSVGNTSITNDGCLRTGNRALCLTQDGDMVIMNNAGKIIWRSGTRGR